MSDDGVIRRECYTTRVVPRHEPHEPGERGFAAGQLFAAATRLFQLAALQPVGHLGEYLLVHCEDGLVRTPERALAELGEWVHGTSADLIPLNFWRF